MLMPVALGGPRLGILASRTGVSRKPTLDYIIDRVAE
jgi:hypothetical protein